MDDLTFSRLRVSAVVERGGPTRPTWLLPDATPEALEGHREWARGLALTVGLSGRGPWRS